MNNETMWNAEEPLTEYLDGIVVPDWVSDGFSPADAIAVYESGCASGAYMPAVTYHQANQTMAECGDDVLAYIEDSLGEIPRPQPGASWSGLAVFYLSMAVELFASFAVSELEDLTGSK